MSSEQLPLPVAPADEEPPLRLPDRVVPMQATQVDAPFDDTGYFFEPWWPGIRAFALAERGRLRLQADGLADADATFPEIRELLDQLGEDGVVLDGTLLVLDDDGRPDPALLRARLEGNPAGRPAYVASDRTGKHSRADVASPRGLRPPGLSPPGGCSLFTPCG